jgi:hypothetical protein
MVGLNPDGAHGMSMAAVSRWALSAWDPHSASWLKSATLGVFGMSPRDPGRGLPRIPTMPHLS